jgi:molybdopterin/thiamine biosynthesis adenylyltransferase
MTSSQRIIAPLHIWDDWQRHFESSTDERMAFGYCGVNTAADRVEYLVNSIDLPADGDYRIQGPGTVSLKAECAGPRLQRARAHGAFVDVHSHPFTDHPWPSGTDERGAKRQLRLLRDLAPGTTLIRMIFGQRGAVWAAVVTGDGSVSPIDEIVLLGLSCRRVVRPINARAAIQRAPSSQHGRTVEVLGDSGADVLRRLRILVVGAGGVGSAVIRQIAPYVHEIAVVDPDVVEAHNAPRLYQYVDGDEGQSKVSVQAREIGRAFPTTRVTAVQGAFPAGKTIELLKASDVVFACPDNNTSRYATAQASARYQKPLIEVGCGGIRRNGLITTLAYHVRLQVPGGPCLACNGMDVRALEDPESSASKRRAGYISGDTTVDGELITLTTRAAADAVDLFFRYVTGYIGRVPRHLFVDVLRSRTLDATDRYSPDCACPLCGSTQDSIAGAGDRFTADESVLPAPEGESYAAS